MVPSPPFKRYGWIQEYACAEHLAGLAQSLLFALSQCCDAFRSLRQLQSLRNIYVYVKGEERLDTATLVRQDHLEPALRFVTYHMFDYQEFHTSSYDLFNKVKLRKELQSPRFRR